MCLPSIPYSLIWKKWRITNPNSVFEYIYRCNHRLVTLMGVINCLVCVQCTYTKQFQCTIIVQLFTFVLCAVYSMKFRNAFYAFYVRRMYIVYWTREFWYWPDWKSECAWLMQSFLSLILSRNFRTYQIISMSKW